MIGAKKFMEKLTPHEASVFFPLQYEQNIAIARLFRRIRIDAQPPKRQQQAVGAVISRINKKLAAHGYVIRPGEKRRTYKLYRLTDDAAP